MTTDSSNSTALHIATGKGHIKVANLLLETETGLNLAKIYPNNGKTVLHTAARMSHLEVVRSFVRKNPSIVCRTDKKGQTALHMAVKGKNVEIVIELCKSDPAILSAEDNKGNTALHLATAKGKSEIVLRILSIEGTNVSTINKSGKTPLDIAEKFWNTELTTILKISGATSA